MRGVDLGERRVLVEHPGGEQAHLPYDYLVIALGSVTNYHHVPGARERSFDLKTLTDAIRLRNHALAMLEQSDQIGYSDFCSSKFSFHSCRHQLALWSTRPASIARTAA